MKTTDQLIKEIRAKKTVSPVMLAEVLERFNEFQKEAIAGSIFHEMRKQPKTPWWKIFAWQKKTMKK